ncbi:prolyl oligopeptidase family serine peptidase [Planococcus sp. CPCC 101016]|uniref:prolyl oligopeptidase family serine peptidase n=1 Tax=Planococcus sp. CPCC 101016 TaxID=2599617 RepID=UPI0011B8525E|nr:prolyl oligopeptidase family serine peptidase [Planococcus sp. CPCC 101016]TWT07281.1 prolyl oligopeptidase family serine peptidase [Planococcus sp. CPCC 101016]
MRVERQIWGHIPLLHITPNEDIEAPLPTVIFFHGHMSAKEHNLHYAYQLAEKGLRVILPDAHLHGERSEGLDGVQISLRFWEIVLTSIEELSFLHEEIHKQGLAVGEPGVGGTSMGGITTLGAMAVYPWIRAAAVMMGAGNYVELAQAQMTQYESRGFQLPISLEERQQMLSTLAMFDSERNLTKFNGRPVYFWHGEQDVTVPFEPTYRLFKDLKKQYEAVPDNIVFKREREVGHAVNRSGMLEATEWLAKHLAE